MKNPFKGFFARKYDATVGKARMDDYKKVAKEVAQRMSGGKILDVGAGSSYIDIEIARLGNFEIVALGNSKEVVEIAKRNVSEAGVSQGIEVKLGGAEDLPFNNGAFDFVVSSGSLHFWKAPLDVLEEIYRVLRSGGGGLVSDLRRDALDEEIAEVTKRMGSIFARRKFRKTVKQSYTQREVERILRWTGFQCEVEQRGVDLIIWLKKETPQTRERGREQSSASYYQQQGSQWR